MITTQARRTERGAAGTSRQVTSPLAFHPTPSDRIAIIYPGRDGSIDGFNDKYLRIAEALNQQGVAAVRTDNPCPPGMNYEDYGVFNVKNLRMVIEATLRNTEVISGQKSPRIMLMGMSAGASAAAIVAQDYRELTNLLLIVPSANSGLDLMLAGIARFRGTTHILAGGRDGVATKIAHELHQRAGNRRDARLRVVPEADHLFTGPSNEAIFQQAPLLSFAGRSPQVEGAGSLQA